MKSARSILIVILVIAFISAACKPKTTLPDPATAVAQTMAAAQGTFEAPLADPAIETAVALTVAAASAAETPLETQAPTAAIVETATPDLAEKQAELIIWAPDGSEALRNEIAPVAAKLGLSSVVSADLRAENISAATRLVISSAPAEAILNLAAEAPLTRFLAVNADLAEMPANVFAYKGQGSNKAPSHAQNAFAAGFLFGLITPEYRAGVISQSGTAEGAQTRGGFTVGLQYYCGLCNSHNAPVTFYPKTAEIADPQNQAEWTAAVDALQAEGVSSVFVQPEVSSQALIDYLRSKNLLLIGVEGQEGLGQGEGWVATISASGNGMTLANAVEVLLNTGTLPAADEIGLSLMNINRAYISEGKEAYFEVVRRDLVSGLIKALPFGQ